MRGDRNLAFGRIGVSFAKKIFTNNRACITLSHYADLRNVDLRRPVHRDRVFIHGRIGRFTHRCGGRGAVRATLARDGTSERCRSTMGTCSGNSVRTTLSGFFLTVRDHCSVRRPLTGHFVQGGLGGIGRLRTRGRQLHRIVGRGSRRGGGRRGFLGHLTARCIVVNGRYRGRNVGRTTIAGCEGTLALCPDRPRTGEELGRLGRWSWGV